MHIYQTISRYQYGVFYLLQQRVQLLMFNINWVFACLAISNFSFPSSNKPFSSCMWFIYMSIEILRIRAIRIPYSGLTQKLFSNGFIELSFIYFIVDHSISISELCTISSCLLLHFYCGGTWSYISHDTTVNTCPIWLHNEHLTASLLSLLSHGSCDTEEPTYTPNFTPKYITLVV